jgi:tetratricopeptide (TPR) repeat protein
MAPYAGGLNQLGLFLRIYIDPLRAFGRVIDEGRLAFAIAVAVLAMIAIQVPRQAEYRRITAQALEYVRAHPVPKAPPAASSTRPADSDDEDEVSSRVLSYMGPMPLRSAVDQVIGASPFHYLPPLITLAVCLIPAALAILTLWESLGRFSTVLFRDYLTLLVCGLMAWAAAYLPLGIAVSALLYVRSPLVYSATLWWAASVYFLALCVCAVRTLLGSTVLHAAGAVAGGWVAAVAGVAVQSISGNISWWLASPCVLYYLYANLQPSFYSLGYGLRSRQRFKQMLETSTINPRDADAHLQLGLIYLQRRQYGPAIERFQKTAEIDPTEADAWYQLGRIARLQGRYADALAHCQTAARLDDKHSASEVWREIGAIQFQSGRFDAARYALEKFVERREYDPEGQCWYGRTLAALGDTEAARHAFHEAIEAARTMPAPRKYQVRTWAAAANKELRGLRPGGVIRAKKESPVEDDASAHSRKSA